MFENVFLKIKTIKKQLIEANLTVNLTISIIPILELYKFAQILLFISHLLIITHLLFIRALLFMKNIFIIRHLLY